MTCYTEHGIYRAWYLQSWDVKENGPIDPFAIAEPEIDSISERLRQSLLTDIPALGKAAEYFFQVRRHSTNLTGRQSAFASCAQQSPCASPTCAAGLVSHTPLGG